MRVAFVIPHRDTPDVLEKCVNGLLYALKDHTQHSVNVLVVDDCSAKDETKTFFAGPWNEVDAECLHLLHRHGFTGAVNAGIKHVLQQPDRPAFIGILNSDLEFVKQDGPKNWLELCLDSLEQDHEDTFGKRNAMVSPMLVFPDGDTIQWAGQLADGASLRQPGAHKGGSRKAGDCSARMLSRYHPFACVLIRTDALAEVGLLDPTLRMYCSDSDWCFRARHMGWRLIYEPAAVVVHHQGHTIQREMSELQGQLFQDHQWFRAKWFGEVFDALDRGPVEQWLGPP